MLLAAAVVVAHLHVPGRPPTLCTLRALTGVPCPFCGGTTAAAAIGHGHLLAALRASPLAVLGAPVVAALPMWRGRLPRGLAVGALTLALALSEMWQLARFSLI